MQDKTGIALKGIVIERRVVDGYRVRGPPGGVYTALLVAAGEPDRIPRTGVERARRWLEDETGSVQARGGDVPLESDRLAALVLLGAERSDRI